MGNIGDIRLKKDVNFFVSYAHSNSKLVEGFLLKLSEMLAPSKSYNYTMWNDTEIKVGEGWDNQIKQAINVCDFGLLLVSPAFLGSQYITSDELPIFTSGKKPCIPILIQPIDFQRHDLKGLEKTQMFMYKGKGFDEARAYGKCKPARRDDFVLELFKKIEDRLASQAVKQGQ